MPTPVTYPPNWPLEMRACTAAAFCDEPSVETFRAKVKQGLYPKPLKVNGCMEKWYKPALEQAIARRHGVGHDTAPEAEEDLVNQI